MASNRNNELSAYLAKIETVDGTDSVPTGAANAIAIEAPLDPSFDYAFQNARPSLVQGHLNGTAPLLPKGKVYQWTKRAWFRGLSALPSAGNPFELDAWMQSAGLGVTYDATGGSEKATYAPINTAMKSITEYWYEDGMLFKGVGARAELGFSFDVGGPVVFEHASHGSLSSYADAALITPTYQATVPPVATDLTTFTIEGLTTGIIRKWAFKAGNAVSRRDGVKATGGVVGMRIGSRAAAFEVTIEEPLVADVDYRNAQAIGTDIDFDFEIGATQYQKLAFHTSTARLDKITLSSDNGLRLMTLSGGIYGATPYTIIVK